MNVMQWLSSLPMGREEARLYREKVRADWRRDWREARITRGHSGTAADAVLWDLCMEQRGRRIWQWSRRDALARRRFGGIKRLHDVLVCYPPAKRRELLDGMRSDRAGLLAAPDLPEWW